MNQFEPGRQPVREGLALDGCWQMNYAVRKVIDADLPVLNRIKLAEAIHRDRIRDMSKGGLHYLVVEDSDGVAGFGVLVLRWPSTWPDLPHREKLPVMVDLMVREEARGKGAGTALIQAMEGIVREEGFSCLYLSVNPVENAAAMRLYKRLGYTAIQSEAYKDYWEFIDSDGVTHRGEEWAVDMVKIFEE